jgi:hypothetical protein
MKKDWRDATVLHPWCSLFLSCEAASFPQLGVQVKRSLLPLRFTTSAWSRLAADTERFGWQWIIAQVERDGAVRLLDRCRVQVKREVCLGPDAVIENLLQWVKKQ